MKKLTSLFLSLLASALLILVYYFVLSDVLLYTFASIIVYAFALSVLWLVIKKVYCHIRGRKTPKAGEQIKKDFGEYQKHVWLVPVIAFSLIMTFLFASPYFQQAIGYHRLGKEPIGGKYAYYVIASYKEDKEYTLPAEVYISYTEDQETSYSPNYLDEVTRTVYSDAFTVSKVFFKNGGYLYFEEPLVFANPNEMESGRDQSGRRWGITLTDRYLEHEQIKEHFPLDKGDFVSFAAKIVLALIQWLLWFVKLTDHTQNDEMYKNSLYA